MNAEPVLSIRNLSVEFRSRRSDPMRILEDVSLDIASGEVLGVVGESGAGKSTLGSAIIGLLEPPGRMTAGEIRFSGRRIDNLSEDAWRHIRGKKIGVIFQDALSNLNPLYAVGRQIAETIHAHLDVSKAVAWKRAEALLDELEMPDPATRLKAYPHELSGGQRQRVSIALALAAEPDVVVADEPTSGLDVCLQAQIVALLRSLSRERGTAIVLITHDMGVVANSADRVAVMYAGRVVEVGRRDSVLRVPAHPYTRGLMDSIPRLNGIRGALRQISGTMPRPSNRPTGCAFHPRCDRAFDLCRGERPGLLPVGEEQVACWLYQSAPGVKPDG